MDEKLKIFEQGWAGNDTVCGWGSTMEHTSIIRMQLPELFRLFDIRSVNDAGCGDLFWAKTVFSPKANYRGFDIYERASWHKLQSEGWNLEVKDITKEVLPPADLVICRDVFIHLPDDLILSALNLFKRSHKYLLSTTFTTVNNDNRIKEPRLQHSKLNLSLPPFNLGRSLYDIEEDFLGKFTSLWELK